MRLTLDLREFEDELGDGAQEILLEVANELVNQLKVEAPSGATGDLVNQTQIFRRQSGVIWLGTRAEHWIFVQEATSPVQTPPIDPDGKMIPFTPIFRWARRKLGADESDSWAIWHKLMTEGTDADPFVDRAFENTVQRFQA